MRENTITFPDGSKLELSEESYNKLYEKANIGYDEVANILFTKHRCPYFIDNAGKIKFYSPIDTMNNKNNSVTKEQLESLLELNKLANVAKYLNDDWLPVWNKKYHNYFIYIGYDNNLNIHGIESIDGYANAKTSSVYFKSEELAKQAIKILGEESIRKALILNH